MDPDGNRLQNSCSLRHWGHLTMYRVPQVSGTTTTTYYISMYKTNTCFVFYTLLFGVSIATHASFEGVTTFDPY